MRNYIYRVDVADGIDKGTTCFELFDDAKAFADECCSGGAKLYGVEVEYNDFGECIAHSDPELLYDPNNVAPIICKDACDTDICCFSKQDITGGPCQEICELDLAAPENPEAGKYGAAKAQIGLATGLQEAYKDKYAIRRYSDIDNNTYYLSNTGADLSTDADIETRFTIGNDIKFFESRAAAEDWLAYYKDINGADLQDVWVETFVELGECKAKKSYSRSVEDYDIEAMVEALGGEDVDEPTLCHFENHEYNPKWNYIKADEAGRNEVIRLGYVPDDLPTDLCLDDDEIYYIVEDFTGTPEERTTHLEKIDKDTSTLEYEGPANKAMPKDIISKDNKVINIPEDEKDLQEDLATMDINTFKFGDWYDNLPEVGKNWVDNLADQRKLPTDYAACSQVDLFALYQAYQETTDIKNKEKITIGTVETPDAWETWRVQPGNYILVYPELGRTEFAGDNADEAFDVLYDADDTKRVELLKITDTEGNFEFVADNGIELAEDFDQKLADEATNDYAADKAELDAEKWADMEWDTVEPAHRGYWDDDQIMSVKTPDGFEDTPMPTDADEPEELPDDDSLDIDFPELND